MRITNLLSAWHAPNKGRSAQPVNKVPFQEILPLKLKERVSGKYDKSKEGGCLQELLMVVTCLQKNEYENKLCHKQIDLFKNCYKTYLTNTKASKEAQLKGILVPGDKNLTHKQIRKLFRSRPLI